MKNSSEKLQKSIEKGEKASIDVEVTNTDRAFATILGAEITRHHKDGLPDDTITINCNGAGGQSFAAFVPKGLTLTLCGDCNDYMGKVSPVVRLYFILRRKEIIKQMKTLLPVMLLSMVQQAVLLISVV